MNKKTYKLIYKLRHEVIAIRKIKSTLENRYGLIVKESEIQSIIDLIPISKKKYTGYIKRIMIRMYRDFYDTNKVVEYLNGKYSLNLTYTRLVGFASENGVKKRFQNRYYSSLISRNDEKDIIELYRKGKSSFELADIYEYKGKKSILDKLNKYGEERRTCVQKHKDSRTYKNFSFEKMDSKEKAYIIGLLITDGYVIPSTKYVGIDLTDEDAIIFISEYINVKYRTIPPKEGSMARLNRYRVVICGEEYIEQLERFGVVANKTFTTKGCNLNKKELKYIPYLLRGIIDGDGWIRKDGKEFFISTASKDFAEWCQGIMLDLGFIDVRVKFIPNEYNGIYLIRTAIKGNIKTLKTKIYDVPFGMSRKFNRLHGKDVQRL